MVLLSLLFIDCNSLFSLSDMLIAELGAQLHNVTIYVRVWLCPAPIHEQICINNVKNSFQHCPLDLGGAREGSHVMSSGTPQCAALSLPRTLRRQASLRNHAQSSFVCAFSCASASDGIFAIILLMLNPLRLAPD